MEPTLGKCRGRRLAWGRVSAPGRASSWRWSCTERWVGDISCLLFEGSKIVKLYKVMKYFQVKVDGVVILLLFLGSLQSLLEEFIYFKSIKHHTSCIGTQLSLQWRSVPSK